MKNVYKTTVATYRASIRESGKATYSFIKAGASLFRASKILMLYGALFLNGLSIYAQNCPATGTTTLLANENTYYPGTQAAVSAGATSITLGPIGAGANFGNTPIAAGDILLIIQMQGAQINIAAVTSSQYGGALGTGAGMLATNLMAGKMEFIIATNAVPVGGGTLNITAGLTNAYAYSAFGANGQYTYQVIRVATHFNILLGATINVPKWNGSTGGITIISAVNQINFNGFGVNGVGAGFRGGGSTSLQGAAGTNKNDFYTMTTAAANGGKGEGIAGTPRFTSVNSVVTDNVAEGYPSGSRARGAPGTGGGGATDSDPTANDQNSGGGGGGNGGAGGLGGNGWFSFGTTGGRGGSAFQTGAGPTIYNSPSRLILGGGGGGGSNNNATGVPAGGAASSGTPGGGMVIINALTIVGTGTIDVSGDISNSTVTIDGSGGGGAGGSILVAANSGTAGITAKANGSDGGSNTPAGLSATQHGPGGGGGGGVIYSTAALNAASTVTAGAAGISTGTSATNAYGALAGSPGVLSVTPAAQLPPNMQICQSIVLPVTILDFSATLLSENNVKVSWSTTDEFDMDYFEVE
jgi:hypothetical protein